MPHIDGVLETALYVEDLDRSTAFYKKIFELEVLAADERFCALNVANRQVLLLFRKGASDSPMDVAGGTIPPHDGVGRLHMAFSITAASLESWEESLIRNGIIIESRVTWERGAISLYFRDPDGHLIELATPGLWAFK